MAVSARLASGLRRQARRPRSQWLTGVAWLLIVVLVTVSFLMRQGNNAALLSTVSGPELLMELLFWEILLPLSPLAYATVGAVIALRRPGHAVSWFSLALALSVVVQDVAWQYAARVLELRFSDWPHAAHAALVSEGASVFFPLFAALLLARFPDGHLPGRRWRYLTWTAAAGTVLLLLSVALSPQLNVGLRSTTANPLALPGDSRTAGLLWQLGNILAIAALAGSLISVAARWRRATGQERQQIKWLAYTGAVILMAGGAAALSSLLVAAADYPTLLLLGVGVAGLTLGVPAAIAVAVLRYRLYDIDAVIRRTVVYALLTLTLLTSYSGSVILLQWFFRLLTGEQSDLAIVGSTAAIATLFNPMRRRIQRTIDRRFYRRSYDAQRTLAAFASAARDEVDLERLAAALLRVVGETMQPASLCLWMPPSVVGQRQRDHDRV